jgi:hypothetical protein
MRLIDAEPGLPWRPLANEPKQRRSGAEKGLRVAFENILGRGVGITTLDQLFDVGLLFSGQALPPDLDSLGDNAVLELIHRLVHQANFPFTATTGS